MAQMHKIKKSMVAIVIILVAALAVNVLAAETVGTLDKTICCEKTNSGLFCQDVREEDCAANAKKVPTACSSTSFCEPGYCFDTGEGTCLDGTPSMVCNAENGTWSKEFPAQCALGCCVIGDQASFVTLVRCKRLSSFWGVNTNFNAEITNEVECIISAKAEEKGACVYTEDFEKTCKFTKRSDCTESLLGQGIADEQGLTTTEADTADTIGTDTSDTETEGEGEESEVSTSPGDLQFYPGKLCTAEELGTICGMSKQTMCAEGSEEVFYKDTCGNPANIYDSSKVTNREYWNSIYDKKESCNNENPNTNSKTCGNCNYLLGSYCREANSETSRAVYGDYICANLNCVDENGKSRMHGESWCVFSKGVSGNGLSPVGSKYYRQVCYNGQVSVEPCADFRQQICIENVAQTDEGPYSFAACRVNRWQECTQQKTTEDCMNEDKRDCVWFDGIEYVLMGAAMNGSTTDGNSLAGLQAAIKEAGGLENIPRGACVPKYPPGTNFWEGTDATGVCAQANAICPVTYKKGLLEDEWECAEHCECLSKELEQKRVQLCMAMGDCGPHTNFLGKMGYKQGYKVVEEDVDKDD
jgi:hypothetical protein